MSGAVKYEYAKNPPQTTIATAAIIAIILNILFYLSQTYLLLKLKQHTHQHLTYNHLISIARLYNKMLNLSIYSTNPPKVLNSNFNVFLKPNSIKLDVFIAIDDALLL